MFDKVFYPCYCQHIYQKFHFFLWWTGKNVWNLVSDLASITWQKKVQQETSCLCATCLFWVLKLVTKAVTLVSSSLFAGCEQISLIRATEITSPSGCVFFIMKWTGNWGNRNLTALVWMSAGEMVGKTVVVINPWRLLWNLTDQFTLLLSHYRELCEEMRVLVRLCAWLIWFVKIKVKPILKVDLKILS